MSKRNRMVSAIEQEILENLRTCWSCSDCPQLDLCQEDGDNTTAKYCVQAISSAIRAEKWEIQPPIPENHKVNKLRARIAELEAAHYGEWCRWCKSYGAPNEPCKSCESSDAPSNFKRRELPPMPEKGAEG